MANRLSRRNRRRLAGWDRRRLAGACVVVTGSSRGIGRETARILLAAGATVVLNGRSAERLTVTETELRAAFPDASLSACVADIATPEGAGRLADHVGETWGRLDGLINNAGVSMRGTIRDLSTETIAAMIDGNILSALYTTHACRRYLEESGGMVVFVSTVGALHGFPGISVYAAAKAALERFVESWNAEYRNSGVAAGIVYLGFVENDPDKEVYSASGERFRHNRPAMQTQRDAAVAIVRSLARRRHRTITVGIGVFLDIAHRLVPGVVTRVLSRSGGRVHSVDRADRQ